MPHFFALRDRCAFSPSLAVVHPAKVVGRSVRWIAPGPHQDTPWFLVPPDSWPHFYNFTTIGIVQLLPKADDVPERIICNFLNDTDLKNFLCDVLFFRSLDLIIYLLLLKLWKVHSPFSVAEFCCNSAHSKVNRFRFSEMLTWSAASYVHSTSWSR